MLIPLTADICPTVDPQIIDRLREKKVNSVSDLLSLSPSKLKAIARNKDIDYKDLLDLKDYLNVRFGPIVVNGFQLNQIFDTFKHLKTGVEKLDQMLEPGISVGQLMHVFGPTNSGKTQFCYTFALNYVNTTQKSVLFVDTDLSFSAKRLAEMAKNRFKKMTSDQRSKLLSRIRVIRAVDIHSVLKTFEQISADWDSNEDSRFKDLGLLVVDSVTVPITWHQNTTGFDIESEKNTRNIGSKVSELKFRSTAGISQMGHTLKHFCRKNYLTLVAITSGKLSEKTQWTNSCDMNLEFRVNRDSKDQYIGIEIVDSFGIDANNRMYDKFVINDNGFE